MTRAIRSATLGEVVCITTHNHQRRVMQRKFLLRARDAALSVAMGVAAVFLVQSIEWWPLGIMLGGGCLMRLYRMTFGKSGLAEDTVPAKEEL